MGCPRAGGKLAAGMILGTESLLMWPRVPRLGRRRHPIRLVAHPLVDLPVTWLNIARTLPQRMVRESRHPDSTDRWRRLAG